MKVEDIMTKNPACCMTDTNLQAVARMMVDNDCGCIPVVGNTGTNIPVGVVTDRDICCRAVAEGRSPLDLTAGDIMTSDIVAIKSDSSIEDCCSLMEDRQIRRVLVVDDAGGCCGIVAQADIANNTGRETTAEVVQEVSKSAAG
jgi:CBS domain-containing protein